MFFEGFILALSLTTSIGPQNTFLLKQGIRRHYMFLTAFLSVLFNATSVLGGILGLGRFLTHHKTIQTALIVVGIVFLGITALRSFILIFKDQKVSIDNEKPLPLKKHIVQCMFFSWANPLVLLENLVILGSISSQYSFNNALLFGAGCIAASALWLFGVTYGASLLNPYAKDPRTWKGVNALTGLICSWAVYCLIQRLMCGH